VKQSTALTFESEVALENVARGLRAARLARGESQATAAARVGVSLATYQRMESADGIARVASGTLFTALCIYGFAAQVLDLGNPENDPEGVRLARSTRQRGRTLGGSQSRQTARKQPP
jgi:transcriptional regulator with XRE-family HTH domain